MVIHGCRSLVPNGYLRAYPKYTTGTIENLSAPAAGKFKTRHGGKDILTGFTLLLASWRPRQLVREVCDAYESLNEGTVSLPSVSAFICQIKLDFISSNYGTSYHKPLLYLYPVSMEHGSKNKERFENRRHS
jgi:hypothetical protein